MDVSGKVMIVTGASAGIGAATARAASRAGARLVLAARDRERLEALAAEMTDAVAVPTDMRNPEDIRPATYLTSGEYATTSCSRALSEPSAL